MQKRSRPHVKITQKQMSKAFQSQVFGDVVHGSCPANLFVKVKVFGPPLLHHPRAKTQRHKRSQWCRHRRVLKMTPCHDELKSRQKSSNCWLSFDDERGKHARQYICACLLMKADHWRKKLSNSRTEKQFDDFPRHLRVRKQNSNLLKLVPELLQDSLDNMKSTYIRTFTYRCLTYLEHVEAFALPSMCLQLESMASKKDEQVLWIRLRLFQTLIKPSWLRM